MCTFAGKWHHARQEVRRNTHEQTCALTPQHIFNNDASIRKKITRKLNEKTSAPETASLWKSSNTWISLVHVWSHSKFCLKWNHCATLALMENSKNYMNATHTAPIVMSNATQSNLVVRPGKNSTSLNQFSTRLQSVNTYIVLPKNDAQIVSRNRETSKIKINWKMLKKKFQKRSKWKSSLKQKREENLCIRYQSNEILICDKSNRCLFHFHFIWTFSSFSDLAFQNDIWMYCTFTFNARF